MSLLRLGSCITYEGDHISRHAGKNSTYEVTLRNTVTGVPVMMVSARNVADRASAISCPLHTSQGADSSVNFNCTPSESIRETFDSQCKPILQAVARGEEPLGTIVIDAAGAGRNKIPTSLLEMIMGYFAHHSASSSASSHHHQTNIQFSPTNLNQHFSPPNTNIQIERAHASLVELDTRGELVDVLDPASPHAPRIDENFDAQSVHVSNATLLDIFSRSNRGKIARSVIAGKHAVCTIFIRRKFDGSLGAVTVFCLQALGDGVKQGSSSSSKKKAPFRNVLQQLCEGLSSDPMPPTLPFSKSNLTFLMKGALCQTHPTSWIIALSPWYESNEDKETFADAVVVMKSARAVASLTDLSLKVTSGSSLSPPSVSSNGRRNMITDQQHHEEKKNEEHVAKPAAASAPVQGSLMFSAQNRLAATAGSHNNNNFYDDHNQNQKQNQYQEIAAHHDTSLSPQTPMSTMMNNKNSAATTVEDTSAATSPIPKENSIIPQPSTPPSSQNQNQNDKNQNKNNNNNVTAVTQLIQQVRSLENLVSSLQGQLKKSNEENQMLKMKNLTLTTQISDVEERAAQCESIVTALQESGKFHHQMAIMTNENTRQNNNSNTKQSVASTSSSSVVAAIRDNNRPPSSSLTVSSSPHRGLQQQQTTIQRETNMTNNNNNYHQPHHSTTSSASRRRRSLISPAVEVSDGNNDDQQQERENAVATSAADGGEFDENIDNYQNQNLVSPGTVWSRRSTTASTGMNSSVNNQKQQQQIMPSGNDYYSYPQQQQQQQHQPYFNSFSTLTATSSLMSSSMVPGAGVGAGVTRNPTPNHQNNSSNNNNNNNNLVVVGYNFDLTDEEEEAVRAEMEKRGIKM